MAIREAPSVDINAQDQNTSPRPWLKPYLIALGILGGLALNGLTMGLVCHFFVTAPTVRAIDRARQSIEANVAAKPKALEEAAQSVAPKPAPTVETTAPLLEIPPAAAATPAPSPSSHRPAKAKPLANSRSSKDQPSPKDPNG